MNAILFYLCGTLAAAAMVWWGKVVFPEGALATLATVVSVLVALLLTTLTTVQGSLQKRLESRSADPPTEKGDGVQAELHKHRVAEREKTKLLLLEDVFVNTSYSILLCVITLLPIMVIYAKGAPKTFADMDKTGIGATFAIAWLAIITAFSLVRILEKVYVLMHSDVKDIRARMG